MVALAATRTLLYIMLGSFPHIPCESIRFSRKVCKISGERLSRFARSGDHGCAVIPKPVPTPKVQRRIHRMMELAKKFWNDDSGQGLAEYALLLGLIVIGVVVFIQGMGGHIKNLFGKANNELTKADS